MSRLGEAVADYLTVRRTMGYKLERHERLLAQFVDYLDEVGATTVTTEHALTWSTRPKAGNGTWWGDRLTVVRGFASYLTTIDPATEVPPTDLLASRRRRATPYLFSDEDIAGLLTAAASLRSPWRATTHQTLLGLLSVTGMRIGEAIRLDRHDLDADRGLLVVRSAKFGKTRQLPLHPSTVQAPHDYLTQASRLHPAASAMFISTAGTRLIYRNVCETFHQVVARAGLTPRSASCRPRLHDFRHSFAVNTMLDAYRAHGDAKATLSLLSTYLGHVDPAATYWYLSAAPELLALAGQRLEEHLGGRQ
jgi:integrase/recombinase XerD